MAELNKTQFERQLTMRALSNCLQRMDKSPLYGGRRYHLDGCLGSYTVPEIKRLALKLMRRPPADLVATTQVIYLLDTLPASLRQNMKLRKRGIPYPLFTHLSALPKESWSTIKTRRGWRIQGLGWTIEYNHRGKTQYPYRLTQGNRKVDFKWQQQNPISGITVKTSHGPLKIDVAYLFALAKRTKLEDVIGEMPHDIKENGKKFHFHLDPSGALIVDYTVKTDLHMGVFHRKKHLRCVDHRDALNQIAKLLGLPDKF